MPCFCLGFPNLLLLIQFCQLYDICFVLIPSSIFLVCFSECVFQHLLVIVFLILNALLLGIEEVFHPKSRQNFLPTLLPEVLQTSYLICTGKISKRRSAGQVIPLRGFLLNAIFLPSVLLFPFMCPLGAEWLQLS